MSVIGGLSNMELHESSFCNALGRTKLHNDQDQVVSLPTLVDL